MIYGPWSRESGAVPTLVKRPAEIADLLGLYLGDEDSLGYYSPLLVLEICRRAPISTVSTFERLRNCLWADTPLTEIDEVAYATLQDGYALWERLKRPRARRVVAQ
jgi:hypothetical protein